MKFCCFCHLFFCSVAAPPLLIFLNYSTIDFDEQPGSVVGVGTCELHSKLESVLFTSPDPVFPDPSFPTPEILIENFGKSVKVQMFAILCG